MANARERFDEGWLKNRAEKEAEREARGDVMPGPHPAAGK